MNKQGISGIKRIMNAFGYSISGFIVCYKEEQAFRQELLLCLLLIPIPFFLDITSLTKAFLILTLFIILIVELLNSAIEAVVDRISAERHEQSKKAKDIASAAVFLSIALAFISWAIILFQF